MSKSWAPAPDGLPTHSTRVRVIGGDTPEAQAVLDSHWGQVSQYINAQHQRAQLSGLPQHKSSTTIGGVRVTYTNNNGQDTVVVEVSSERLPAESKQQRQTIFDMEFGGYILFQIARVTGDPLPVDFSFKLNGSELLGGTFAEIFDSTYWGLITFGEHALKYHSFNDTKNQVTQKFIPYPEPRYRDKNYKDGTLYPQYTDDPEGLIILPTYKVFDIAYGVLETHNMTWWDAANTPLFLDGLTRFFGAMKNFDDIKSSPLDQVGLNVLTVETSSSGEMGGQVFGEFFSRSTRQVEQSWRRAGASNLHLIVNDQPTFVSANFTNELVNGLSSAGFDSVAQWYGAYNDLPGMVRAPVASTPDVSVNDSGPRVLELIIDLSK